MGITRDKVLQEAKRDNAMYRRIDVETFATLIEDAEKLQKIREILVNMDGLTNDFVVKLISLIVHAK